MRTESGICRRSVRGCESFLLHPPRTPTIQLKHVGCARSVSCRRSAHKQPVLGNGKRGPEVLTDKRFGRVQFLALLPVEIVPFVDIDRPNVLSSGVFRCLVVIGASHKCPVTADGNRGIFGGRAGGICFFQPWVVDRRQPSNVRPSVAIQINYICHSLHRKITCIAETLGDNCPVAGDGHVRAQSVLIGIGHVHTQTLGPHPVRPNPMVDLHQVGRSDNGPISRYRDSPTETRPLSAQFQGGQYGFLDPRSPVEMVDVCLTTIEYSRPTPVR